MRVPISVPQNPTRNTVLLAEELLDIIPGAVMDDGNAEESEIKIKIVEDTGPQWIVLQNKELQIVLKIIGYKSREHLRTVHPISKNHPPQLVVNNFTTETGMRVAGFLATMFPFDSKSRQVANFTVQGDFLYFRLYRYCFGEEGPVMENVGPHLTLRLWRMTEYTDEGKKTMNFKKFIKNATVL